MEGFKRATVQRRGGRHNLGIYHAMSTNWTAPGPSPRKCQYIVGVPTARDDCKCGTVAVPGFPYCSTHAQLCYDSAAKLQPEEKRDHE